MHMLCIFWHPFKYIYNYKWYVRQERAIADISGRHVTYEYASNLSESFSNAVFKRLLPVLQCPYLFLVVIFVSLKKLLLRISGMTTTELSELQ